MNTNKVVNFASTPTPAKIADDAIISVCRYVRPIAQFRDGAGYSNLGGVTLLFTMDYGRRTVNVKFSICRANENFNKKDGITEAAKQRGVEFNLDKFQLLADHCGGFTNAYLNMLNTSYVAGTLNVRETTLFHTLNRTI